MNSNRQKKKSLVVKRAERQEKRRIAEKECLLKTLPSNIRVNRSALAGPFGYSTPDFVERGYYTDETFKCRDCGVEGIWTATQQKWWYETQRASLYTSATRCKACRRQHGIHREKSIAGAKRKLLKRSKGSRF